MPANKPATPLPFRADGVMVKYVSHGEWRTIARAQNTLLIPAAHEENARYLAHAANAYPRLVEALRELAYRCDGEEGVREDGSNIQTYAAAALLRDLGEDR